ncbi:hypothetical protein RBH29_06240 [Herbivorax sp. ANBcel31]|uniref:hypothetical protein n=1 Tax=Herbivorax sp. ANBcel31 TaxID=3069754 RepID=UPI0027B0C4EF|nr:hypothetical protein [Herbivorax sp. ANBcel31]MDQ2086038.1 hypothetical protein [Herbivorax sp. ANBcel31]
MNDLSFISFILISFPEQILIFILGTISIGKKNFLKSKGNFTKSILVLFTITLLNYFSRKFLNFELESTIFSILFFVLMLIYVLKYKFYESITVAVFGFLLIIIVEIPLSIILENILEIKSQQDLYNNYSKLIPFVFLIRFTQTILAFIFYKFEFKILDMEKTNIKKKEFYLQIVVYLLSILSLIFLTTVMARTLIFNDNISSSNTNLLRINICITLFITVILSVALRGTYIHYKNKSALNNNEVIQSIEYIDSLINQQNYGEAKDALQNLKTHITKN